MFYFDEFFYEFKKNIFKYRSRKMNVIDGTLFVLTIIFALASLVIFELKSLKVININKTLYIALLVIFVTIAIIVYISLLIKISKENKDINFIEFHKENVTDKIIELLKSEQYGFYNVNKLDWLMNCCCKKLSEKNDFNKSLNALKSLGSWFLPLFTLALGIIVQKFSDEELIYYIAIIVIGAAILYLFSIMFIPVIEYFNCPNKKSLEYLLGELEFIKTNYVLN